VTAGVTFGAPDGPFGPFRNTVPGVDHLTHRGFARILGDVKLNAMSGQQV
jgi:hypothetical protein